MRATRTKSLILCALFAALIAIGAFIKIPLPALPVTLQVFFVILAGQLLGGKLGFASAFTYLALGLVGLPIFTGGGGPGYVLYPSFGYIIGFALGALVTGVISYKKKKPSYVRLLVAGIIGILIIYACGMAYAYLLKNFYLDDPVGLWPLVLNWCLIFIPGDLLSCLVSSLIANRIQPLIRSGRI